MTPSSASSPARRPSSAPRPSVSPARRPPVRLVEPARRPRPRRNPVGRHRTALLAGILVVGSLVSVVVGDDLVAQGRVRLAVVEQQVAAATTTQRQLQVSVALLSAPEVVVSKAENRLGMVAASRVVDLPQVPLNVPLPPPQTAPLANPQPTHSAPTPVAGAQPAYV